MSEDIQKYLGNIDAIITTSDPDQISPKKIRKCLEELYGISLDSQRKQLNELIIDRFNVLTETPKVLVDVDEWEELNRMKDQYAKVKLEVDKRDKVLVVNPDVQNGLRNSPSKSKKTTSTTKKKKKTTKKKTSKKRKHVDDDEDEDEEDNSHKRGIMYTELLLSPELQAVVGEEKMPRTKVVKALWDYIKERNLQNPENRREIIADDLLKPIIGKKVSMFQLHKKLSDHLSKLPSDNDAEEGS